MAPLVDRLGMPKIWRIGASLCLTYAGLSQDSKVLALLAEEAALNHEEKCVRGYRGA